MIGQERQEKDGNHTFGTLEYHQQVKKIKLWIWIVLFSTDSFFIFQTIAPIWIPKRFKFWIGLGKRWLNDNTSSFTKWKIKYENSRILGWNNFPWDAHFFWASFLKMKSVSNMIPFDFVLKIKFILKNDAKNKWPSQVKFTYYQSIP